MAAVHRFKIYIAIDLQKSYCAALERRETVLLTLLDRQVELKQEMIEEARIDVAAARARILAAKEEGQLSLQLITLKYLCGW